MLQIEAMEGRMTFEEANDIISRRYSYRMKDIPTDEEIEEAEKAFGVCYGTQCYPCARHDVCCMVDISFHCNFFTEAPSESIHLHDLCN